MRGDVQYEVRKRDAKSPSSILRLAKVFGKPPEQEDTPLPQTISLSKVYEILEARFSGVDDSVWLSPASGVWRLHFKPKNVNGKLDNDGQKPFSSMILPSQSGTAELM